MAHVKTVASARRAFLVLLLANLALVAFVFRPLGVALFLAAVLAGALWPAHHYLATLLGKRPRLAASLLMIAVVVLLVGPLIALSAFIVGEASEGIRFVSTTLRTEGVGGLLTRLPDSIEKIVRSAMERLSLSPGGGLDETVQQQVGSRGGKAVAAIGALLAGTGSLLFQAAMMMIALFVFLTEKDAILRWIDDASPLAPGQTHELMREFRKVSVAVLRSTILTAGVQAIVALGGYFIARVPYALFFAAVTFFVAMVPAVGAASVCVACAGLLLATGHHWAALFLAVWGIVVVGLADNVVKPLLIRHGVAMHGAVVFFALLSGLAAFGAIGLLLGPLAAALFVAMLRIYRRDYGGPPGAADPIDASRNAVVGGPPGSHQDKNQTVGPG